MDNNLPVRKRLRKLNFDYNTPGAYFITICTHHKKCTLSRIVGAIQESPAEKHHPVGAIHESPAEKYETVGAIHESPAEKYETVGAIHESPAEKYETVGAIHESSAVNSDFIPHLLPYGKIIDEVINHIPEHYPAYVDRYVIMHNHIHFIIVVKDEEDARAIRESPLRIYQNDSVDARAIRESPLRGRSVISKMVGYIKMNASKEIHKRFGDSTIWQRGFHDHIIRNREDYEQIAKYIYENPARWQFDCFYVEDNA